jgi:hypothetical protein
MDWDTYYKVMMSLEVSENILDTLSGKKIGAISYFEIFRCLTLN